MLTKVELASSISANQFIMKTKLLLLILLVGASFGLKAQIFCNAQFTYTSTPNGVYTFAGANNSPSTVYFWNFGNGSVGSGQNVTATFNPNNAYTVCLTVQDTFNNCVDSFCQVIGNNTPSPCNADYSYVVNGTNVTLTNTSTAANTMSYSWKANGVVFSTAANPVYTNSAGTYNICLNITDNVTQCSDSICYNVVIGGVNPACQASFYIYPDSNGPAHTYIGVNTSTNAANMSYVWTWGDGSSSTGQYPAHTYAAAGQYTICLTISSPGTNCVDSFCLNATINKNEAMYSISFANPNSVNDVSKNTVRLFPNPASNMLQIEGLTENARIQIQTLSGAVVLDKEVTPKENISISQLISQMYVVRVLFADGHTEHVRLIKQ
jgi:PKD repeat protein